MALSLYDISIPSYLQVLGSTSVIMAKGEEFARENGLDLAEIVATKLRADMLPFHFQAVSVFHHSLGAVNGVKEGVFGAPPSMALDYAGLQALVEDARDGLQAVSREEIEALEGKAMKFKMGKFEIPFTAENFILSFSMPNVYFHVTTLYDILRIQGVPLGKTDFLGQMRMGS